MNIKFYFRILIVNIYKNLRNNYNINELKMYELNLANEINDILRGISNVGIVS